MGNITEMFAPSRGFWPLGVELLNDVRQILPRQTPVATATKFEIKWTITQFVKFV